MFIIAGCTGLLLALIIFTNFYYVFGTNRAFLTCLLTVVGAPYLLVFWKWRNSQKNSEIKIKDKEVTNRKMEINAQDRIYKDSVYKNGHEQLLSDNVDICINGMWELEKYAHLSNCVNDKNCNEYQKIIDILCSFIRKQSQDKLEQIHESENKQDIIKLCKEPKSRTFDQALSSIGELIKNHERSEPKLSVKLNKCFVKDLILDGLNNVRLDLTDAFCYNFKIKNSSFSSSSFNNSIYEDSDFANVEFHSCDFSKVNFNTINCEDIIARDSKFNETVYSAKFLKYFIDISNNLDGSILKEKLSFERHSRINPSRIGVDFKGKSLAGIKIIRYDFIGVDLEDADFSGCDLSNVHFSKSVLSGTNFSGATLFNTSFKGAIFSDSKMTCFDGSRMSDTEFGVLQGNLSFKHSKVGFSDIFDYNVDMRYLDCADLGGADLSKQDFRKFDLSKLWLEKVHIDGADFTNTNLNGVNFRSAVINNVDFTNTNISGENFPSTYSDMSNLKDFQVETIFEEAGELINCDLSGCDLSGAF